MVQVGRKDPSALVLRLAPYILAAAWRLLLAVPLCLLPPSSARSEKAAYGLFDATGLFWQLEIVGDDGLSSASDGVNLACCGENAAQVLGDLLGDIDPSFTPKSLSHQIEPAPIGLMVGVHPVTLAVSGSLAWNPPSGPSLKNDESGPMPTGQLSAALFTGALTTPFGSLPFGRSLLQHTGGDTTLRRFFGATDEAPPSLHLSSMSELLDRLEIDVDGLPQRRIEMRSPYEAVLIVSSNVTELGSVSYALSAATGLFWEITITADDGAVSSATVYPFASAAATLDGQVVGVVDPLLTPELLTHSIAENGLMLTVGQQPVELDLSGFLEWSLSGVTLQSGQAAALPTGDASDASFGGELRTPFGDLPINLSLANQPPGQTLELANLSQPGDPPPTLRLSSISEPLDTAEIDEGDVAGRVDMKNPFQAVLGTTPGAMNPITWSISIRLFFNDAFHDRQLFPNNGASRDVSWTLRAQIFFNDLFHESDPSLLPATVPALGQLGRLLLAALLLAGGIFVRRRRRC